MTCINAAGWVAYGYAVANPYIFPANVIGFLAGLFFTMTAFIYATRKVGSEQSNHNQSGRRLKTIVSSVSASTYMRGAQHAGQMLRTYSPLRRCKPTVHVWLVHCNSAHICLTQQL